MFFSIVVKSQYGTFVFPLTEETSIKLNDKPIKHFFQRQDVRVISIFTASVILNGIGDGLNDSKIKGIGHTFNIVATGTLLTTPFFINDNKNFWLYILSYACIRYSIFDISYNLTRGLPYNYVGNSAYTDKILNKINPNFVTASKIAVLGIGFYIPIRYF